MKQLLQDDSEPSEELENDPIEELSELLRLPYSEVERIYHLFDEDPVGFTVETFERVQERRQYENCWEC
ncbi:MAG: hypothetical protein IJG38_01915 [Thermoguttaceae bacterium]|nr:hypothetical protein [Thermoguttaceae bacterium]